MKKCIFLLILLLSFLFGQIITVAAAVTSPGKMLQTNIPEKFPIVKQDPSSTVVSFWHAMTANRGVTLVNICNWFNATEGKKKKIYVKPIYQGEYNDISLKIQATIQANNPKALPDVVQLSASGFFSAKESKNIVVMGDMMKSDPSFAKIIDKLNANSMYSCSYKGKQYGLPFMNSAIMMHFNKDAFKSVGLNPNNPPKTLAEYADACSKLIIKGAGKKPLRYGGCGKVTNNFIGNWISRQKNGTAFQFNQEDGFSGIPTKYTADSDGTMKSLLTEWKKVLSTNSYNSLPSSYLVDYTSGYSCSFFGSNVLYSDIQTNFASFKDKSKVFNSGMARYPSVNANDAIGTGVAGSALYMFNRDNEKSKAATWEFVKFLTSIDVSAYWSVQAGYFAINQDALNTKYMQGYFSKDSNKVVPYNVLTETNKFPKFQTPLIPSYAAYDTHVQNQILLLTLDKITIDQTIESIAKKANSILNTYSKMVQ